MVYTLADGTQMTRRQKVILTGGTDGALTDYQLKLAISHAAMMQNGFDDLRLTQEDMRTLIDAWLEAKVDGTSADVWVEFPGTPASGAEQTKGYMYYGNAGAANVWDGDATFLEFLDKNNTAGWTLYHKMTVSTSGDFLRFYGSNKNTVNHARRIDWTTPSKWILEARMKNINIGVDMGDIEMIDGGTADSFTSTYSPSDQFASNKIYCYGSATYNQLGDWTEGTEYIIKHVVDESNSTTGVDYYYYDTARNLLGSSLGNEFYSGSPVDADGILIGDQAKHAYSDLYFRWILLRKYAANPPTYAFSSEEHQRRMPMMI